ncbi:SPASM domain-containing protein [Fusibacter sp. JL298sf-3]
MEGKNTYVRFVKHVFRQRVTGRHAPHTKETTSFYMTGLNDTIDLCLDCLSNIVIDHTSFENDFFENEKKVVFKEIDSYLSSFNQIKERMTQQVKKLVVTWFGGEPTLTLEEIRYLSEGIIASCEKNNCAYEALMVTNGYLLDEETLNYCLQNGIERFQITIDGTEAAHDSLRPLENGEGTFSRIEANLLNLLNHDVELVLRVNVNAMNYQSLDDVLDIIPAEHRRRVSLSLVNVFQNASKFRLYDGYVKALEKGYDISFINLTKLCTECRKNAMTVEPDGDVVFCSMAGEAGIKFGKLTEEGILAIVNQSVYYKFKTLSAFDSEKCRTCDEAPWCLGGCRLARLGNAQFCVKERGVDLTVRDKIKLSLMSANG